MTAEPKAANPDTATARPPESLATDRFGRASIFVLRMLFAGVFLQGVAWKIPPDFGRDTGTGLFEWASKAVEYPVFPPYSLLVENLVLPNIEIFGWMVILTEGALGAFFLIGLATRLMGLIGFVQSLAIFLSVGLAPNEWPWAYYFMMGGCLVLAGTAAGRVAGVDAVLRPRLLAAGGWLRRLAIVT